MKTLLILEDDTELAINWQLALEAAGYTVRHAADTEEAIRIVDEGGIDLVISDLLIRDVHQQPRNTGGLTLLSHIKLWMTDKPPVIAVSGTSAQLNLLDYAGQMEADVVLRKPVSADEIVAQVKQLDAQRD